MIKKRKKILILGVTGLLGSTVYEYFYKENYFEVIGVTRKNKKFNKIANFIQINAKNNSFNEYINIIKKIKPDFVINCIGIVKKSINKKSFLETIHMNSLFPKSIEQITKLYGFKFIHISTDCVFKGDVGRYDESFFPDATDIYGISKILG